MEETKISGEEWAVDENCLVHKAGNQFQISIKQAMVGKLNLKGRDVIKIYAKVIGHEEKQKREIKNNFNKPKEETEIEEVAL